MLFEPYIDNFGGMFGQETTRTSSHEGNLTVNILSYQCTTKLLRQNK